MKKNRQPLTMKGMGTMQPNVITALFLVATVLAVGAYDVYAAMFVGETATVSVVIQDWSRRFPAFTLLCGFVLGHLFWSGSKGGPAFHDRAPRSEVIP